MAAPDAVRLHHCSHCDRRFVSGSDARLQRCARCGRRLSPVWMPEAPRAEPGTYPDTDLAYASLEDFVEADPSRLSSKELDFGLTWRAADGETTFRAAWIVATGELYAVQLGPPSAGGGHVEVLAVAEREGVEAALECWAARRGLSLVTASSSSATRGSRHESPRSSPGVLKRGRRQRRPPAAAPARGSAG